MESTIKTKLNPTLNITQIMEMTMTEMLRYCADNDLNLLLLSTGDVDEPRENGSLVVASDLAQRFLRNEREPQDAPLSSMPKLSGFIKAAQEEGLSVFITDAQDPKNTTRLNFTWNAFLRSIGVTGEPTQAEEDFSDIDPNLLETLRLAQAKKRNLYIVFNGESDIDVRATIILRDGNSPVTDASLQALRGLLEAGEAMPSLASV